MKFLLVLFIMTTSAFAADKACEKKCKSEYESCTEKVRRWSEDQYIDLEGLSYYSMNCDIDDKYDQVRKQEKLMKKSCKEIKKECLKTCDTNVQTTNGLETH